MWGSKRNENEETPDGLTLEERLDRKIQEQEAAYTLACEKQFEERMERGAREKQAIEDSLREGYSLFEGMDYRWLFSEYSSPYFDESPAHLDYEEKVTYLLGDECLRLPNGLWAMRIEIRGVKFRLRFSDRRVHLCDYTDGMFLNVAEVKQQLLATSRP